MPKPKFVKPLLIGLACTIPVGLVVGLSINWDHTIFISSVGSSGVKPFIESFAKQYHQQFSNYDVTVESGGSTFAIEQIAQGYTNLGNTSTNPYDLVKAEGFRNQWQNKKTFTIGWEGLVLVYSLPNKSQFKNPDDFNNFNICINQNNILSLYGVFSGYYELKSGGWTKDMNSLWYYASDSTKQSITNQDDIELLKNTKISPFVRTGGNTGANSSIAFSKYSNLVSYDDLTPNQKNAFDFGQYGNDGLTITQTDESNSRAWQSFVGSRKPGSMVYLTTSFLANEHNREMIKQDGYKIAGYKNEIFIDGTESSLNSICKKADGYNWFHPIDVIIDLNVQKAKDFIYWIYTKTLDDMPIDSFEPIDSYKQIVYNCGAKPLDVNLFETMLAPNRASMTLKQAMFDSSCDDLSLEESRQGHGHIVYGAEDGLWSWS